MYHLIHFEEKRKNIYIFWVQLLIKKRLLSLFSSELL